MAVETSDNRSNASGDTLMSGRTNLSFVLAVPALALALATSMARAPLPADHSQDNLPPGAVARLGEVRLTHSGQVDGLAFSPDGKLLATAGGDGILRVWDVVTGREKRRLDNSSDKLMRVAQQLTWSPDGKTLALTGQFTGIRLLEADTLKERMTLATSAQKGASPVFAFAPDSQAIVWWANDGLIRLYDLRAQKEIRSWPGVRGHVPRFAFAPDGKKLAVVNSLVTSVLDVATGNEIAQYKEERYSPYALTFSPDGKTLALGGYSNVRLCDLTAAKDTAPANGASHKAPIQWLRFTADGKTLYSSSHDGEVKEWDVAAGKEKRSFNLTPGQGTANPVSAMAYSPDGTLLAWVAWSNRIRLTKLATGEELLAEEDRPQAGPFVFTPDGKHLITPSPDGKPRLWDAATGKLVRRFEGKGDPAYFLGLSADGRKLVTVGTKVIVWDVQAGKEAKRLEDILLRLGPTAALSADGKLLALGEVDLTRGPIARPCKIRWWDLETGKEAASAAADHQGSVQALAFAPSGKTLVSAGADRTVRVWEVSTGKQLASVPSLKGPEGCLAFGDGGKKLLSAQRFFDGSTSVVRVTEREPDKAREGKSHDFTAQSFAAFAPDGSRVALLPEASAVRVLDLASEQAVVEWKGNQGTIGSVAFSADGKTLATGGSDGTILIWDIARARKP
jgi:WD40 repeat protein